MNEAAETAGTPAELELGHRFYPEDVARKYRSAGVWTRDVFARFLDDGAMRYEDDEAVVGQDQGGCTRRWSYRELLGAAVGVQTRLIDAGVRPGDRVIVQLPNTVEFIAVIGGVFRLGAIPVFAIPAHRGAALREFASATRPAAFVTVEKHAGCDHRALAEEVVAATGLDTRVLIVGRDIAVDPEIAAHPADTARHPAPATVDPEGLALLQVSGGTTGIPKLIPRTHAAYHYSVRESARICRCTRATRFLVVIPAAHNFALSSPGILGVLHAGGCVVVCPDPVPSTAFRLIERERITMTALVPPLLMAWLATRSRSDADLSALEMIQVGGAVLPPEAAARVAPEFGCRLQQVFGMAEGLVNYTRLDDPEEIVTGTQGRPISELDEISVRTPQGEEVEPGTSGVLWTRGPYTIRSYVGGVGRSSFDGDGFYSSGDIVRRLPSGHFVVEGRAKDHINRAGEKISAEEVENHIIAIPGVVDAAVVGVPSEHLGECTCAFISTGDGGARISHADVIDHLRRLGLEEHKYPDRTEITEEFPVTGVGKLSRVELRARLRESCR